MSEKTPGYNPEKTPFSVRFGDVVRCGSHNPHHSIMITDVDKSHYHSGIAIVDHHKRRYGMPGTIPPNQILEIVDHIPYEEAIEMLVHSLGERVRGPIENRYRSYREG